MEVAVHVVVAPDKFKGSLTAKQVAAAVAAGINAARPGLDVRQVPVADGGDGTVDAALAAGYRPIDMTASGPTLVPVTATIAVRADTAVVELATASGLTLLPDGQPAPLTASSHGTGQLIAAALDAGCHTVVLGVGGSACTDGGAGMLTALGARLLDAEGRPLPPGGAALVELATLDLSGLDGRVADTTVVLASDVDNPLLGPHGAAAVYGPQKGAGPEDIALLETGLARLARAVAEVTGRDLAGAPGAGAAGGVGFAALAVLGATQRPGIEVVLELVGLAEQLEGASLVVTGEGRLDTQSLHGKAPIGVARAAARAGVPVLAVAGSCELDAETLREAGISGCYPLADIEPEVDRSKANAAPLLTQVSARLAEDWLTLDVDPA